ncbi:small hydrophobic protein [Gerbil paramyxovirus]|uniref:Small hydrophobic protein n=1 Tax=Gerbil paramyxovirus TaxID=2942127 RepID=A0A977IVU3_9MONO|nr:small hydrophobic protein [Gerbil paramyxovirus]UWK09081.1 small hydrophobic protein [Gerbil paramyxovirus]
MERDVSMALYTIFFVCTFWYISSIIWFVCLTIKIYKVKVELLKKMTNMASEIVFLQEQTLTNMDNYLTNPPAYTRV